MQVKFALNQIKYLYLISFHFIYNFSIPKTFFVLNCILNCAFNELYSAICLVWNSSYVYFPNQLRRLQPNSRSLHTHAHTHAPRVSPPTACNMPKQIAYSAFKLHTEIPPVCVYKCVCASVSMYNLWHFQDIFRA